MLDNSIIKEFNVNNILRLLYVILGMLVFYLIVLCNLSIDESFTLNLIRFNYSNLIKFGSLDVG